MVRYIEIQQDTKKAIIGYNYLKNKFYVINKGNDVYNTLVYREDAEDALQIVLSLGITTINDINIQSGTKTVSGKDEYGKIITTEVPIINPDAINYVIQEIYQPYEILEKMTYTVADNGSYIRTIQFNEWKDYPLEVDCEKGNILIRNTSIVYSLDVDEDAIHRIKRFMSYYRDTLGLDLSYPTNESPLKDQYAYIRAAYWLLANQYLVPHFYNQVLKNEETEEISYTNIIGMANFNNLSPVVCSCERNAHNKFNPDLIGNILTINTEDGIIDLSEAVDDKELLMKGFKVSVEGTEHEEDEAIYSADGTYTINEVYKNNLDKVTGVKVEEPITSNYNYPYPDCYVKSFDCAIYSMLRENNVIKVDVNSFPESLLVGDTIHVENAKVIVNHEEIDLGGPYTVNSITPQIKEVTDTVVSAGNNTITLSTKSTELKVGDIVKIHGTNTSDDNQPYEIITVEENYESSGNTRLTIKGNLSYSYGVPTGSLVSLKFQNTTTSNLIVLPASFANTVINPGDLIQISGFPTSANNKTYTILQLTRNADNTTNLSVDSTVTTVNSGTGNVTLTPMNPVTISSSTTLYYNIYVEEEIATDFVSEGATFYKEVFISKVKRIRKNEDNYNVTLFSIPTSAELVPENNVFIYVEGNKYSGVINSINSNTLTVSDITEDMSMPNFPSLSLETPSESMVVTVTSVADYLVEAIPTGDFDVDNYEECQDYILTLWYKDNEKTSKYSKIPKLEDGLKDKMYYPIDTEYEVILGESQWFQEPPSQTVTYTLYFGGLYGDVYKGSTYD